MENWRELHGKVIKDFLQYLNSITDEYVLKGGTSLMICYGLDRFSEDIDLDSTNKRKISKILTDFCNKNNYSYRIAKDTNTTKRYFINYGNDIKPLKIEISYRKNEILPEDCTTVKDIKVYNLNELCRMKTLAYTHRDKIRDLYDVTFICNKYWNDLSTDNKKLIQNCFEYKGLEQFDYLINNQADELIDPDKLAENFLTAYEKAGLYIDASEPSNILYDMDPISKDISNNEKKESTKKTRLFVDIDGTLAVFKPVDTLETLYEKGYFLNLEPHENVVAAVNELTKNDDIEVFIMSSVLSDSKYALDEKNEWINKYLPQIDMEHRIFPPCGSNKVDYIPEGVRTTDCLLDDYTHNLTLWQPPAKGIKLLNGINHTHGTWQHDRLDYNKSGHELAKNIMDIVQNGIEIKDLAPAKESIVEIAEKMTSEEISAFIDGIEVSIDYQLEIDENDFKLYKYLTSEHKNDLVGEKNPKSLEDYKDENTSSNILFDKEVPDMDKEQNKENGLSEKEQQKNEMIESIKSMAEEYVADPDKLIELFKFKEQFYNYSLNNSLLIAIQNPNSLFVGSYKKFKDMGYNVKRGEHGMKILVPQTLTRFFDGTSWKSLRDASPEEKKKIKERAAAEQNGKQFENDLYKSYKRNVFGIGHVFDIAQTDCPAENYPEIIGLGFSSEQHKQLFDVLSYFSQTYLNCPVIKNDFSSATLRGLYNIKERKIEISSLLQDTQALSTLTHEMGHAILHNDRTKSNTPTCQKELEADALSIMLDIHLGLDVPDARRSHLHAHFCKFNSYREEHKDDENVPSVIDVLNNVEKIYRNVFEDIDSFIENTIDKDLSQHRNLTLPDKYPFVLFPYSEADIDTNKVYNIKDADELIHSLNNDYLQYNLSVAEENQESTIKPTNFVLYLGSDEIVTGNIAIGQATGGLINHVEQIPDIPAEKLTNLWNTKDHIIAAEYTAKSKECALNNNMVEANMYDKLAQTQKQNIKNRIDYFNSHGRAGEKDIDVQNSFPEKATEPKKIDKTIGIDR